MKKIKKAIVSVFNKDGLDEIILELHKNNVEIYSTGGTAKFIKDLGVPCNMVENLTGYPEILGGRVKTLHPAIFGGLLYRSDVSSDVDEITTHNIPEFDLMISNLYPFEEYVRKNASNEEIIEKIDIGGVTLIRAAAKNFKEIACISSPDQYSEFLETLKSQNGSTSLEHRMNYACSAFSNIVKYDEAIFNFFMEKKEKELRYGENPHQEAKFIGDFDGLLSQVHGKEISYNNILDIDAALRTISDFSENHTFAIFKHNNPCGLATRASLLEAYKTALSSDPKSAFGGVLISNTEIDAETAEEINKLFFEIIIAPSYNDTALELLKGKKNRIILVQKRGLKRSNKIRTALNGTLVQQEDNSIETRKDWEVATKLSPSESEMSDLEFGIKAVKHLKSNSIALVKNQQLIGMGCGHVSRIDALHHAISKAKEFGLDINGAIMSSDAFFPFADCVEIAKNEGINSVSQPGGSIRDKDSIQYCNENNMSMVLTGVRHFNH